MWWMLSHLAVFLSFIQSGIIMNPHWFIAFLQASTNSGNPVIVISECTNWPWPLSLEANSGCAGNFLLKHAHASAFAFLLTLLLVCFSTAVYLPFNFLPIQHVWLSHWPNTAVLGRVNMWHLILHKLAAHHDCMPIPFVISAWGSSQKLAHMQSTVLHAAWLAWHKYIVSIAKSLSTREICVHTGASKLLCTLAWHLAPVQTVF